MRIDLLLVWQALVEELHSAVELKEEEMEVKAVEDERENAPLEMVMEDVEEPCFSAASADAAEPVQAIQLPAASLRHTYVPSLFCYLLALCMSS